MRFWKRRHKPSVSYVAPQTPGVHSMPGPPPDGSDRAYWLHILEKLARPVLSNLAAGTLRSSMPIEQSGQHDRRSVAHLEAFARVVAGIAPWLELPTDDTTEGRLRADILALTHRGLEQGLDPASPDHLNFSDPILKQPLVDAAFLAQALLRAPHALTATLSHSSKARLIAALESTRTIEPNLSNWLLFPAMVEAGLATLGAAWEPSSIERALHQHEQWYLGDGSYGDGPEFHWDYYNSFVIQPMLLDVINAFRTRLALADSLSHVIEQRALRMSAVLERLVAPDGSFPPLGRSIAYRAGAFHLLAMMASRGTLPAGLSEAQVRCALTAVIHRTMDAPQTFDERGWLQIGLAGHQPHLGEPYITTGSLYLCSVVLLPLGLSPQHTFWSSPAATWTSAQVWSGHSIPIDRALSPKV